MKSIRAIAAVLLILDGLCHIYSYLNTPVLTGSPGILLFGIIYLIIGLLLFIPKKYPIYLGLIIPLIGMTLSVVKFGIPELISMSNLFKVFGLLAVICCGIILFRHKSQAALT